jgi:hypothetical protein
MSYSTPSQYGTPVACPSGHAVQFDPVANVFSLAHSSHTLAQSGISGGSGSLTSVSVAGMTRDEVRQLGQFLLSLAG